MTAKTAPWFVHYDCVPGLCPDSNLLLTAFMPKPTQPPFIAGPLGNIINNLQPKFHYMKKCILLLPCVMICYFVLGQDSNIKVHDLMASNIPKSVNVSGSFLESKQWMDNNGDNLLIISRKILTTKVPNTQPVQEARSAYLYIDQYIKNGKNFKLIWSYQDSVVNCMSDYWIGPLENSISITDLDLNKISEITIVYSYASRSDVSPAKMKVIVFDGIKTRILQGTMYAEYIIGKLNKETFECNLSKITRQMNEDQVQKSEVQMGRYDNENDFIGSSKSILDFAINKWKQFMDKDKFELQL
jgi:hypothetical protein